MDKKDDSLDRRRFLRYIGAGSGMVATGCLSQSAPSDESEDGETTIGGQQESVEEGSQPSQKVSKRFLPEVSWSFDTDGQVYGSPAVVDGVAYIGSHDGRMYAFAEEGTDISVNNDYPMFNYDLQNTSAPDTEGPTGEVVQAWSYPTQGVVTTAPAVVDGKVYFGSEDNYFYCLSADDGSEIWKFDAGGMISGGSPTVRDGVVYLPTG